jgi:hypothetical protein
MEIESLQYLKSQIEERVRTLNKKRHYYRKVAFRLHLSLSVLAAVSTVVLGLNMACLGEEIPRISVLVITGIISVISAYNAFFDNKQLWVAYNNALNEFYKLLFEIEFTEKGNLTVNENKILEFKQEYQKILDRLNKTWTETRSK